MNNFNFEMHNFEGFTNRTGLYRVWVPLHDDGRAPLISIWVDPKMTALTPRPREEPVTISGVGNDVAQETEDSRRRCITVFLRTALQENACARNSEALIKGEPWTELVPR
jgi:hypothetical protein